MARTHNNGTEEPEGNYVFALEIDGVSAILDLVADGAGHKERLEQKA